jgi:hypothetical protein
MWPPIVHIVAKRIAAALQEAGVTKIPLSNHAWKLLMEWK